MSMLVSLFEIPKSVFFATINIKILDTIWGVTFYGVIVLIIGGIFATIAYFLVLLMDQEQVDNYNSYISIEQYEY